MVELLGKKTAWILCIAYMLCIFYFSSMSHPPAPVGAGFLISTLEHVLEYFILGLLLAASLRSDSLFLPVFLATLYGVSDEFHQYFIPGRVASPLDVFADFVGCFLGVLFWRRLRSE